MRSFETSINVISNFYNYGMNNLLVNFLQKFFFILNLAAKGWKIRYLGANKFKITKSKKVL